MVLEMCYLNWLRVNFKKKKMSRENHQFIVYTLLTKFPAHLPPVFSVCAFTLRNQEMQLLI